MPVLRREAALPELLLHPPHMGDGAPAGHGLDPADAGGHGRFMDDLQKADVARPRHMGPPAELPAVLTHPDDADRLPVPLVEDRRRPRLHRLGKGKDLGLDGAVRPDHPVGLVLDACHLLLVDPRKMGEVEPEPLGVHEGAGLLDVLAQDLLQGGLEEMGPGVVRLGRPALLVEHLQAHRIPLPELPGGEPADMGDEVVEGPLRIRHIEDSRAVVHDHARIADLAAGLPVERGPGDDHLRLVAFADLLHDPAFLQDGRHLGPDHFARVSVPDELRGDPLDGEAVVDFGDRLLAAPLPGLPRLLPLGRHRPLEPLHVEGKPVLPDDVGRQVRGEAEGVVELEDDLARDHLPARPFQGRHLLLEDLEARVEGVDETLFLVQDDLPDERGPIDEVGIGVLHLVDDDPGHLVEEGPVHAEELPVARRPPEDPPEDIAAPLVAGQNAVADEEGHGPAWSAMTRMEIDSSSFCP